MTTLRTGRVQVPVQGDPQRLGIEGLAEHFVDPRGLGGWSPCGVRASTEPPASERKIQRRRVRREGNRHHSSQLHPAVV